MFVITLLNIVVVFMAYLARFEKHRYLLAWAFVLISLVLGIRYGYGNDFFNYEYFFEYGIYGEGNGDIDPGWLLLNKLFKPFGFSTFVFFLTAIENLMLYDLIRRYVFPQYYWFALFIYLFNPMFMLIGLSMMRQFLVQVLGLYAVEKVYKKKWVHYILIVFLCVSIHKIGLLLIPLAFFPFIYRFTNNRKILLLFVGIVFLFMFFIARRMDDIINFFVEFFAKSGMKYGDSYLTDLNKDARLNPKLVLRYAIYIFILVRNYIHLSDSKPYKLFAVEVTLGLFFLPFATIYPMAVRVSWIYSFVIIISLPLLLQKERIPIFKYATLLVFSFLLLRDYENHFISDIWGKQYINFYTIFSEYAIYDIPLF